MTTKTGSIEGDLWWAGKKLEDMEWAAQHHPRKSARPEFETKAAALREEIAALKKQLPRPRSDNQT